MTHTPSTDAQPADHFAAGPSWLLPEHSDRRRMVDMDRRLRPIRMAVLGVLALVLLLSGAHVGFWTLLPLVFVGGLFALADRLMDRVAWPEYLVFAAWAGAQIVIAAAHHPHPRRRIDGHGMAGDPGRHPQRPLLVARRHRRRRAARCCSSIAVPVIVDLQALLDNPPIVIAPAALVVCVAILTTALMKLRHAAPR